MAHMENRSAPPGQVVPRLIYRDVARAIDFLREAFGFTERLRTPVDPDGSIHHAQVVFGDGAAILTAASGDPPIYVPTVMVRVDDVDAHFARAKKAAAKIVAEPASHMYGERQYSAEDVEGNRWTFTQSVADVAPESWGAEIGDLGSRLERLRRPRVCYLEIPATDVHASAAFYERVFGWNIRHRDTDRPGFDDATGSVSGAWVAGRPAAREGGLLPYVWVDGIDEVLARAVGNGGQMVEAPHPDHPGGSSYIATFRDPAGNLIGLYEEQPRVR